MAYFSNGTEGMALDMLCLRCVHGYDIEKAENRNEDGRACAAWELQSLWNYEQHDRDPDAGNDTALQNGIRMGFGLRSREAKVKKEALDTLLPQNDRCLCAMYRGIADV